MRDTDFIFKGNWGYFVFSLFLSFLLKSFIFKLFQNNMLKRISESGSGGGGARL